MAVIGAPVPSVDWPGKTDGSLRYAADLSLPGMLLGGVVRSPHPHARIVAVDVTAARAVPGVRAVLTARDLPDRTYLDYRPADSDRHALARNVVRYVGDPVVALAADDPQSLARGMAAVRVRYRRLPAPTTVGKALRRTRHPLHAAAPDNVAKRAEQKFGDLTTARARTASALRARYRSSPQAHATMEPHAVVAWWRGDENRLHVWAPSQAPRIIRRDLAQMLELTAEQVHLNEVGVGGDFGGRTQISSLEVLAGALSMAADRPVRLVHTRAEEFSVTKSRVVWDLDLDLGCDAEGRLTYLEALADVDNGAYNMAGPGEMEYGLVALGSTYRWHGYAASGRCVYTSTQPSSSFRGAGGYAVNFALECAVDELADRAGVDPVDFRIANALGAAGDESLTGWRVKSGQLANCLELAREHSDWDAKRARGGAGYGIGVACSMHVTALHREHMMRSSAALDIHPDGTITVRSGVGDAGTGQKTIVCQAVAEVLGVDVDAVRIISTDTDETPHDAGAGASRGSFVSVSTARQLAADASEQLRATAAEKFHTAPAEVELAGGHAVSSDHSLPLGDVAVLARDPAAECLSVTTEFVGEIHQVTGYGHEDVAPTYSFAVHVVEVQVDADTGKVDVLGVLAVHDSGTVLNPITARGQVEGGVVMGLGAALGEELIYEGGRIVNSGYVDYSVPRATEAPAIHTLFVQEADPVGPFGAKGLGEIVLLPTGAALANAIAHATGNRLRVAPFTPDRVLTAQRVRDGLPTRAGTRSLRPHRAWVDLMRFLYPRGLHATLHRWGTKRTRPTRGEPRAVCAPTSTRDALLAIAQPDAAPVGGCTDLLASRDQGLPVPATWVALGGCSELRSIDVSDSGDLLIGAAVTLAELERDGAVDAALRDTVRQIASAQLRESATVGGNLCQAKRCWFYRNGFDCYKRSGVGRPCYAVTGDHRFHHAVAGAHRCQAVTPSDLSTTLLALDAELEVRSHAGHRALSVSQLYRGPGETVLAPGEAITRVVVPAAARERRTRYRKLSLYSGGFAVVSTCVGVQREPVTGAVLQVRAVLGGVAPVPLRLTSIEEELTTRSATPELIEAEATRWLHSVNPLPGNHWKAFAARNLLASELSALLIPTPGPGRHQCS